MTDIKILAYVTVDRCITDILIHSFRMRKTEKPLRLSLISGIIDFLESFDGDGTMIG
jgi:hypothetical protein